MAWLLGRLGMPYVKSDRRGDVKLFAQFVSQHLLINEPLPYCNPIMGR